MEVTGRVETLGFFPAKNSCGVFELPWTDAWLFNMKQTYSRTAPTAVSVSQTASPCSRSSSETQTKFSLIALTDLSADPFIACPWGGALETLTSLPTCSLENTFPTASSSSVLTARTPWLSPRQPISCNHLWTEARTWSVLGPMWTTPIMPENRSQMIKNLNVFQKKKSAASSTMFVPSCFRLCWETPFVLWQIAQFGSKGICPLALCISSISFWMTTFLKTGSTFNSITEIEDSPVLGGFSHDTSIVPAMER